MDYTLYGTTYGLALSSGLNAYFPLLAFAVAARWLHLYKVNPNFSFVTQTWFIGLLAVLTIFDLIADKIPLIDHTWDAIHTAIRPIMGALVVAASYNQVHLQSMTGMTGMTGMSGVIGVVSTPNSSIVMSVTGAMKLPASISLQFIGLMILGAILALMVHTTKATTRVASTATTFGLGNVVLSVIEDIGVLITTLLSLFAPIIMFILIVIFVVVFFLSLRLILRVYRRRRSRSRFFI